MFIFSRHALFIVRCWRAECLEAKTASTDCVTTNAYTSLELNAHGLVLLIDACRASPALFLTKCFTSQTAEALFRELRSMTGTSETAVEFSMKQIGERLRRAFMKVRISYKQKSVYEFPDVNDKLNRHTSAVPEMPTDYEISCTIEQARTQASSDLVKLGVPLERQNFNDSLNHDHDFEFVSTGTHSDLEDQPDDTVPISDDGVEERDSQDDASEEVPIYDAGELFENFSGELKLKSTTTNTKHTFCIRDSFGKVHNIKKSKVLYMLTPGRIRQTATRTIRYRTPKQTMRPASSSRENFEPNSKIKNKHKLHHRISKKQSSHPHQQTSNISTPESKLHPGSKCGNGRRKGSLFVDLAHRDPLKNIENVVATNKIQPKMNSSSGGPPVQDYNGKRPAAAIAADTVLRII